MESKEPFVFCTERRLVRLTGRRAATLAELLEGVREAPPSCVFYHTHHMYLAHHFESPGFSNDFARWAADALQEDAVGEKLAALDLLSFTSLHDLQAAIVGVLEREIAASGHPPRRCRTGAEFHYCRAKSFVMPTGLVAHTAGEFFQLLSSVSNASLFFHFFEARLRLHRPTNDFSNWLRGQGEEKLARAIDALDPYTVTLDQFKQRILALGEGKQ